MKTFISLSDHTPFRIIINKDNNLIQILSFKYFGMSSRVTQRKYVDCCSTVPDN